MLSHALTTSQTYVTLHHGMSFSLLDVHFHIFILSESKFYALFNGENHFQIKTSGRATCFLIWWYDIRHF